MKGVFGEHVDPSLFPAILLQEEISLVNVIKKTIVDNGLANHKPFEDKIMQMYQVSQTNQGELSSRIESREFSPTHSVNDF